MISVAEAKRLISQTVKTLGTSECSLSEAVGKTLGETVVSPFPLPMFDNSAMDGYALYSTETEEATERSPVRLKVIGSVAAGETGDEHGLSALSGGEAVQVFTGAPVALGDAVIRQEDVVALDDEIEIRRRVEAGENVRRCGEELEAGLPLLQKGTLLTPAAIGTLAGVGIHRVKVFKSPRVGVIVTGSEIVTESTDLEAGKIFDSNSYTIAAALQHLNVELAYRGHAEDTMEALGTTIEEALGQVDFLLITGGVSVGKFDYVKQAVAQCGVDEIFWRIKQKPGKPLFFGATDEAGKIVFGLPGNPASVLVCFYEYVRPALLQAAGLQASQLKSVQAKLSAPLTKRTNLTHFLKGRLLPGGVVEILDRQGSHMMSSFAAADCLVVVPEDVSDLPEGAEVEVHLLPI